MTVYIGLGSNLGDRLGHLQQAIDTLHSHPHITVTHVSPVYETKPVGMTEQPTFLNMVIALHTSLSPQALLWEMQQVEAHHQRKRTIRWGPRTLDLDLLLYGERIIQEKELIVPHPRMCERPFVLIPLRDVAGNCSIPGTGKTIDQLLSTLSYEDEVRLIADPIQVNR